MILNKIVNGYVSQLYDTEKKKVVSQEFVAADAVEWEHQDGIMCTDELRSKHGLDRVCCPMDMVQPDGKGEEVEI